MISSMFQQYFSHIRTIDGWMTCKFTAFSTVFQSYPDNDWVIMEAVCNAFKKITLLELGSKPGPLESKPALNLLSYWGSSSGQ